MSEDPDLRGLFGTTEPTPERRQLRAGQLTAVLEEGALRDIRYGGVEGVRAISYLARDTGWGTYKPELSGLSVEQSAERFRVSYQGDCAGDEGRFRYQMLIEGDASGRLRMEANGAALTDFPTNRTGFVVLHPLEAAGRSLSILHTDGQMETAAFPEFVSPDQPAFDVAALSYEPAPGLSCSVSLEGDAFEMEDQRNWTDASFKTYVRPLSKPRPYVIGKGQEDIQSVSLVFEGAPAASTARFAGPEQIILGAAAGVMPGLSLFIDPAEPLPTGAENLRGVAREVSVRYDPADPLAITRLREASDIAETIGAALGVEAIFDCRDPSAEAERLKAALDEAGVAPRSIYVAPRREFKTRPANTLPEGEVSAGDIVRAVRERAIAPIVGSGTPSNFTEFNRNPPGGGEGRPDFVFFGCCAVVHAADDQSVMQTISAYSAVIGSAKRLCPGVPLRLGPCTIGTRHNPYGAGPAENLAGGRLPMARLDPRHASLFGAAFAVGVAAKAAAMNVAMLSLASPSGAFGLLRDDDAIRPIAAVHAELARAAGKDRLRLDVGDPRLAIVAYRSGEAQRILIANLSDQDVPVALPHPSSAMQLEADGVFRTITFDVGDARVGAYRTLLVATA